MTLMAFQRRPLARWGATAAAALATAFAAAGKGIDENMIAKLKQLQIDIAKTQSAANTVFLDIITRRGRGSGHLSATTISLTAHWPCDQLCRSRYWFFQFVPTPFLTRFTSSNHLDNFEE